MKIRYRLLTAAAVCFSAGYMLVSNRQLRVNKYTMKLNKLPESFEGKKILLIADLHKKRYGDKFDNIINSSVPNAFPSVNDIPQNNVNIPSFNIPSSGQETVEITGQAMENIDQSVPTFQPTDLNQMPNPENLNIISNGVMPTQNNNMAQETVPFDGNLWAPHNPDASSMMQPTENFNNQVTNNSIFAKRR